MTSCSHYEACGRCHGRLCFCPDGERWWNRGDPTCKWCNGFGFVRSSIDPTQSECPCVHDWEENKHEAVSIAEAVLEPLVGWMRGHG